MNWFVSDFTPVLSPTLSLIQNIRRNYTVRRTFASEISTSPSFPVGREYSGDLGEESHKETEQEEQS